MDEVVVIAPLVDGSLQKRFFEPFEQMRFLLNGSRKKVDEA